MNFNIETWWHWVFVLAATFGSAWNACRVFFEEFEASHNPVFTPFFQFWYELAGSMAGWMSLWALLPLVLCLEEGCSWNPRFLHFFILLVAIIGIFGRIPDSIGWVIQRLSQATGEGGR